MSRLEETTPVPYPKALLLGFDQRVEAVVVLGACGAAVEMCVHAGNGGVGVGA
jgi:hypothetical protein